GRVHERIELDAPVAGVLDGRIRAEDRREPVLRVRIVERPAEGEDLGGLLDLLHEWEEAALTDRMIDHGDADVRPPLPHCPTRRRTPGAPADRRMASSGR